MDGGQGPRAGGVAWQSRRMRDLLRDLPVFAQQLPDFDPQDVPGDPFALFRQWLTAAIDAGAVEPHAVHLATVDADGRRRPARGDPARRRRHRLAGRHQRPQRQGAAARRRPVRRAELPLARTGAAGTRPGRRRAGRRRHQPRGFPFPLPRFADRGPGGPPERRADRRGPSWTGSSPASGSGGRRPGADQPGPRRATRWCPSRWSSGRATRSAGTPACATAAPAKAGRASCSGPERSAQLRDQLLHRRHRPVADETPADVRGRRAVDQRPVGQQRHPGLVRLRPPRSPHRAGRAGRRPAAAGRAAGSSVTTAISYGPESSASPTAAAYPVNRACRPTIGATVASARSAASR